MMSGVEPEGKGRLFIQIMYIMVILGHIYVYIFILD